MAGFGKVDGFYLWVDKVEEEAKKHGRVFVMECFEGNERNNSHYNDGLEVQELSGWLLTPEEAERYKDIIEKDAFDLHKLGDDEPDFVWVNWKMDGDNLLISFELCVNFEYVEMKW